MEKYLDDRIKDYIENKNKKKNNKSQYDINTYVDKIFYINMDKDTERNKDILEQFKKFNITNYERISGVVVSYEEAKEYTLFGPFSHPKIECKNLDCLYCQNYFKGSVGCLMAHKKILEIAKGKGYKRILILEDDIIITDNFHKRFNEYINKFENDIKYWNMLYLGLACNFLGKKILNKKINNYLIDVNIGGYSAHAYIVQNNTFDLILNNIDYCKIEIDLLYNSLHQQKYLSSYKFIDDLILQDTENESNIKSLNICV